MVDFRNPQHQFPHGIPIQPTAAASMKLKPLTQIVPDHPHQGMPQASAAHNRSRTASSSVFPSVIPSPTTTTHHQHITSVPYQNVNPQGKHSSRRSLSNATTSTSTTGTGGGTIPARSTSNSFSLRRSTSSRSNGAPTGYVALMRKQKATVWCDRSQYEDPRLVAQQKAARLRAAREVVGSPSRSSTGGSGSLTTSTIGRKTKIRHHGNNMVDYSQASFVGGVPMRLSASEVGDEGNSDDDGDSQYVYDPHRRTASGRSSLVSGRRSNHLDARLSNSNTHSAALGRFGDGTTPDGLEDSPDNAATPMPHHHPQQQQYHPGGGGYFAQPGGTGTSGGSGDSAERENSFGDVGQMVPSSQQTTRSSALGRERSYRTPDELRRRGSVDDRAMTMSTGRLYVANPDLSD